MESIYNNLNFYRDTKFLTEKIIEKKFDSGDFIREKNKKIKNSSFYSLTDDKKNNIEKNVKISFSDNKLFGLDKNNKYNIILNTVYKGYSQIDKKILSTIKNDILILPKSKINELEESSIFVVKKKYDFVQNGNFVLNNVFRLCKSIDEFSKLHNPSFIITSEYFKMCGFKSYKFDNQSGVYNLINNVAFSLKNSPNFQIIENHKNAQCNVKFEDTLFIILSLFNKKIDFEDFYSDIFIPESENDSYLVYNHINNFNDKLKKCNEFVYLLVRNYKSPIIFVVSLICVMFIVVENYDTSQTKFEYLDLLLYFFTCNRINHLNSIFSLDLTNWEYYMNKYSSDKNIKENSKVINGSELFNSLYSN